MAASAGARVCWRALMIAMGEVTARGANVDGQRQFAFLGNFVLTLLVVGYPISASISQISGLESNSVNIAFRSIVLTLSITLGFWSVMRGVYRVDFMISLFFIFYTIRIVWDFYYSNLPLVAEHLLFYIASTLLPTLAIGGGRAWYDEQLCLRLIAWIGGLGGLLVGYLIFFVPGEALEATQSSRLSFQFLNPISIGYHGLYIIASSMALILTAKSWARTIIYGSIALLGASLLIGGGSRGPYVALALALLVTGRTSVRKWAVYLLMSIGLAALMVKIGSYESILERFLSTGEDLSSLQRLLALERSIQAGLDHPLVGYAYIEPTTGLYPHNLAVEAWLALGLGGGMLLLMINGLMMSSAWRHARRGEWLIPFLASAAFASSWMSGSIWSAGLFFSLAWIARDWRHDIKG